jgi:ribonuclease P protein component
VRARRRSWAHPLLVLYAAPQDGEGGPARSGFVVGRRVGNAVGRNRVKRRLREAVRARQPALVSGMDLVWIARPPIAAADYAAIGAAVGQLLRRARILREKSPGQVGPGTKRPGERAPRGRPPAGHADSAALTT